MKTLSLEASKILQEYIPESTEYGYNENQVNLLEIFSLDKSRVMDTDYLFFKTLTLTEAIDMLPHEIRINKHLCSLQMDKFKVGYGVQYLDLVDNSHGEYFEGKTLLIAVEKMLLYLHNNNLLI